MKPEDYAKLVELRNLPLDQVKYALDDEDPVNIFLKEVITDLIKAQAEDSDKQQLQSEVSELKEQVTYLESVIRLAQNALDG